MEFGEIFEKSWNIFSSRFGILVSLGVLFSFLPNVILEMWKMKRAAFLPAENVATFGDYLKELQILSPLLFCLFLLSIFLTVSVIYVLNYGSKKKPIDFSFALKGGWSFYGKGILLNFLLLVFLIPLFLLLIVPGIIFSTYWVFAFYVLIVEKSSINGALKGSHDIVRGRWWKVFGYLFFVNIIIWFVLWVASGILGMLGTAGVFLRVALGTLTSLFSLVFINTFYSDLVSGKVSKKE